MIISAQEADADNMRILDFRPERTRLVGRYGSRFRIVSIETVDRSLTVSCMYLEAGGRVGRHRTTTAQLFLTVEGKGWVRTGRGSRRKVESGKAVSWKTGEWHEVGSEDGMTAIVVEHKTPAQKHAEQRR